MRIRSLHRWNLSPRAAIALQERLRTRVCRRLTGALPSDPIVAGADISYNRGSDVLYAAVVLLRLPDLAEVERQSEVARAAFPYVPGLLSFREAPALLRCFRKLTSRPDLVMIDGQGIAHPRRIGIASHLGLVLDLPTIGCAKSILCGRYELGKLGLRRGSVAPLVDRGEEVGQAVRTRDGVNPVFVSVGHNIDLATAVVVALRCGGGYRIPEPTRQAHMLVNELRIGGTTKPEGAARRNLAANTKDTKRGGR
jgi:deoxyribonuclease V